MEPILEQTQQGTSYEVSVSAEGVEELKRKVKIKGEKKESLLTLRQKLGKNHQCKRTITSQKKILITKSTVRRDLQLEDAKGVDCLPDAAIFEQLTLMGFVQVFLDKQLEGMSNHNRINVLPSHTKKIFGNLRRVGKGFSGRETPLFPAMMVQAQEEMGKAYKAINEEMDDSLVRAATTASSLEAKQDSGGGPRVNTPQSDKDSLKLKELMELYTTLQSRVLDLKQIKATQANEIDSLKRKVKKLKKKQRSRTHKLKRLYKVGLTARVESFDDDEDLGKDASKQGRISDINADEGITLVSSHDDADQDLSGEEVFVAKQDENVVEKKLMLLKFKLLLLQQLLQSKLLNLLWLNHLQKKKRKYFAAKKVEEKRNKPPTQAQQRKIMCTYLKNIEGKKLTDLKNKSFKSIHKMFDRAFKRVNTSVDLRTKLVEESSKKAKAEVIKGSSKRAGTELEQESSKKQKINDDKETAELTQLVNLIPDEEGVEINAIHLAVKPPSIIDWKIHKEGKKSYY
nr:hypothetical protein [Tanacetum cinerariifolium]